MVERIYVKPLPGKRVTDPVKWEPIPGAGCWVNKSPFWLRRLKDKDVEFTEPPMAIVKNTSSKKSSKEGGKK